MGFLNGRIWLDFFHVLSVSVLSIHTVLPSRKQEQRDWWKEMRRKVESKQWNSWVFKVRIHHWSSCCLLVACLCMVLVCQLQANKSYSNSNSLSSSSSYLSEEYCRNTRTHQSAIGVYECFSLSLSFWRLLQGGDRIASEWHEKRERHFAVYVSSNWKDVCVWVLV